MRKYKYILFFISFLFLIIGCRKEKLLQYDFGSGIAIYKNDLGAGRDSLVLSFAVMDESKISDTVELPLRIVGLPVDYDREVLFDIIKEETTADKENYEFLPSIIPANSYVGVLKIKINRTELLKTNQVKIWIQLLNSLNFQVGPKEQSTYLVKVNDYLTKPASWNDIRFGEYSQTKYSLIIRETGYSDFMGMHPEVLLFIIGKCRNVLTQYIQIHGAEMLDENQLPVRFP